jgi:Protein of unknown function (DUF4235)
MIKLLYKPVDLIASMVGGLLAGLIFKTVWKLIGQGDAPKPTDERRGWGEILLAAMLQGTIFALVKTAADRGAAEGTRRLAGIWPGDEGQQPDESL